MLKIIQTTPYTDQKMGTAGLRKKSKVVMQENYFENFLQSIFNVIKPEGKTYVVGGDGRFYNATAIQKLIKMAAANGVKKLIMGQNGYLSTPASSNLIFHSSEAIEKTIDECIIPSSISNFSVNSLYSEIATTALG